MAEVEGPSAHEHVSSDESSAEGQEAVAELEGEESKENSTDGRKGDEEPESVIAGAGQDEAVEGEACENTGEDTKHGNANCGHLVQDKSQKKSNNHCDDDQYDERPGLGEPSEDRGEVHDSAEASDGTEDSHNDWEEAAAKEAEDGTEYDQDGAREPCVLIKEFDEARETVELAASFVLHDNCGCASGSASCRHNLGVAVAGDFLVAHDGVGEGEIFGIVE